MFVLKFSRKPHYDVGVITGGIGQEFPKVVVISGFKLVLNNNRAVLANVGCKHIQKITADCRLRFL